MLAWDQDEEAVKTGHKQKASLNSMSNINT